MRRQGLERQQIDLAARLATGGKGMNPPMAEMIEQGLAKNRASRIVVYSTRTLNVFMVRLAWHRIQESRRTCRSVVEPAPDKQRDTCRGEFKFDIFIIIEI